MKTLKTFVNKILFVFAVCFVFGMNVNGQCPCQLVIASIDDPYADIGCNEAVTVLNNCCNDITLDGVTISDNAGVRHTFSVGTTLAAGASVTITAGNMSNENGGGSCSTTTSGGYFNNSADCAVLGGVPAAWAAVNLGYNNSTDTDCSGQGANVTIVAGESATQPAGNISAISDCDTDCSATCSITIDNVAFTEPTCTGATLNADGTITITATGTNLTGALQYSIDGGTTWQATGSFTALAGGSYNIVVEDDGDTACTASEATATVLTDPTCAAAPACNPSITSFPVNN